MAQFYAILTNTGLQKLAQAQAAGEKVELVEFAVGDGGGGYVAPLAEWTSLENEVWRDDINRVYLSASDQTVFIVEGFIARDVGGWYVREMAVFDTDGDMIGVANNPETYEAEEHEGAARDLHLRMLYRYENAGEEISFSVDPSVVLATHDFVTDQIEAHALLTGEVHGVPEGDEVEWQSQAQGRADSAAAAAMSYAEDQVAALDSELKPPAKAPFASENQHLAADRDDVPVHPKGMGIYVGQFGIGPTARILDDSDDIDDALPSGLYAWASNTPQGADDTFQQMLNIFRSSASRSQLAMNSSGRQRVIGRGFTGGQWEPWFFLLDEKDLARHNGTVPEIDQDETLTGRWRVATDQWFTWVNDHGYPFAVRAFGGANRELVHMGWDFGTDDLRFYGRGDSVNDPTFRFRLGGNNVVEITDNGLYEFGNRTGPFDVAYDIELGGDFDPGATVTCMRRGPEIIIASTDFWNDHQQGALAQSADGAIPSQFRPMFTVSNVFFRSSNEGTTYTVVVTSSGRLELTYVDADGDIESRTSARPFSISYAA